jgi:hypothetical protein
MEPRPIKPIPSQAELRERFHYDARSGELLLRKNGELKKTGYRHREGYRAVIIDGVKYAVHRLIWVYNKGDIEDPTMVIDHIDGDGYNNRMENLRLVTQAENAKNTGRNPNIRTVSKYIRYSETTKRFYLRMSCLDSSKQNVSKRFGSFATLDEAVKAREREFPAFKAEVKGSRGTLVFDD